MKTGKVVIGILAVGLVVVMAAVTFAHDGYGRHRGGYGGHRMGGPGYGYGQMMDGDAGFGPHMRGDGGWGGLTAEQVEMAEAEQARFFDQTRDLRRSIYEKEAALQSELARQNPDSKRVSSLQKELSGLGAEFDQLALKHRLAMDKLAPEAFTGRGMGRRGGAGPGYCW